MFSNVTAEDRDEFDREVAMLAKLMHPCIMNLYGISQDHEGSLYMVSGTTLAQRLIEVQKAQLTSKAAATQYFERREKN